MPSLNRYLGLVLIIAFVLLVHFLVFSPSAPDLSTVIPVRVRPPKEAPSADLLAGDFGDVPHRPSSQALHHPLETLSDNFLTPDLDYNERGILTYDPKVKKHPIELLIERGQRMANAIEQRNKNVNTLEAAVADYEAAYGMRPPRGFDSWFKHAQANNAVSAASMLPMAHRPFVQFLSIPAAELRKRVASHADMEPMYYMTFVPNGQGDYGTECDSNSHWYPEDYHTRGRGRVKIGGPLAWKFRCNNTLSLMLPVLKTLPDELFTMDPPLTMLFNTDDGPRGQVHYDFQNRAESLGRAFKTWTPDQLEGAEKNMEWTYGWQWTCPENSPLKRQTVDLVLNDASTSAIGAGRKEFVADYNKAMDVCYNPELRNLQSAALLDSRLANVPLTPYVSQCRTLRSSDLVAVPLDGAWDIVHTIPWKEKKAKVFWRGSATGLFHDKNHPWRQSQRERLHVFANNASDHKVPILLNGEGGKDGVTERQFSVKAMGDRWFDIGLAGGPVQCDSSDGSCEELAKAYDWRDYMNKEASVSNKYVIDVDGNAWSSRFRRLLSSDNVVLKASMYPEWLSHLLVPWYHYVPVRADYSDIYDIMAFFEGAPDGSTPGRDDLAAQIAANGLKLTQERWRNEDMRSFMLLITLEYWRMMADDRESTSLRLGRSE